jgi:hypothetical protein
MKYHFTGTSAVLALLISAGLATAQTTTPPTFETAVSTGIVGWAPATQTAQLNVLNLSGSVAPGATTSTTPATTCPVELEFHDAQNNVLKSVQVSNLAPGMAASLTLKLSDLSAGAGSLRAAIRGVVKYNSVVTGPIAAGGGPMIPAGSFSICAVLPTLELFDNSTGVTQTFISDTRPSGTPVAVPLTIMN